MAESIQAFFCGVDSLTRCVLELVGKKREVLSQFVESPLHCSIDSPVEFVQELNNIVALGHQSLDGVGRGGSAYICDKVRNKVVLFVSHR